MKTREEALAVLKQYNESEALLRHGYAVEGVMRHFAALKGEDVEYWGQVGLLHDVDYEKWPEEHLKVAPRLWRRRAMTRRLSMRSPRTATGFARTSSRCCTWRSFCTPSMS